MRASSGIQPANYYPAAAQTAENGEEPPPLRHDAMSGNPLALSLCARIAVHSDQRSSFSKGSDIEDHLLIYRFMIRDSSVEINVLGRPRSNS